MPTKRHAGKSQNRNRGVRMWGAILAGAILLAVLIAVLHPGGSSPSQDLGLRVGAVAPTLPLQATDGREVSLASYRGHALVLFFYEGAT